ncbi:MAG TPA: isochorismatase family cysteine hydrolase [Gaiellaceae bacterium]|nr:isochorismatase family cysteine hydrolase [Gaiellaceae bacterium]
MRKADDLDRPPSSDPFAPATWDLVPGRTALVLIDLQNDFLHERGWYAESGVDITHMRRVVGPTRRLVAAARAAEVPVIWTRHGFRDATDAGPFFQLRPFLREGGLRRDTWGFQIYDELAPDGEDWLVEKNRLSAFYNTNLELILRGLGAETVLIAGVLTNQCIAATSKDAMFRDFKPIVVEECTGTTLPHLHEPALEMVRVGWGEVRGLEATIAGLLALRGRLESMTP